MKKLILIFLSVNICVISHGQIIKGTIFDNKTKEIIYSASVYINGTSVGTLSDRDGNFVLDISKYGSMPLTISAIGYYSTTIKKISSAKPLMIYLDPKLFELETITVNAKFHTLQRKENLTIFRYEFLGTTANATNCEITNEDDIKFKYSADKDTLKAFTTKPLFISNKALGYKITYFLDKFEYSKQGKTFFYKGNIIFSDDSTSFVKRKQYFKKKRKNVYLGSRMHFFRALWADDLNTNGFTVRNSAKEIIGYNKLVSTTDDRTKYLSYPTYLGVAYYTLMPTSFILLGNDKVFFDAYGYYDPDLIIWEGEMARQRIADLLPYEYVLK
jgi:hypothetical protein